jgi:uncharacterized membrane protein
MSLRKRVRDFVYRNELHAWAITFVIALVIAGLILGLAWMFKPRPCMPDTEENWPYTADWWPGRTGHELEKNPENCADP